MSSSVLLPLEQQNDTQAAGMDVQPVKTQVLDDDVICISKNKKLIKKRSIMEAQKRSRHESQYQ